MNPSPMYYSDLSSLFPLLLDPDFDFMRLSASSRILALFPEVDLLSTLLWVFDLA
jgi:hypothetical protein